MYFILCSVKSLKDIYEMLYNQNPGGSYCAEIENEKLVSFCGSFPMDEQNMIITSYVTQKEYRGQGYGLKVFTKVIEETKGKNLFINAADGMETIYARIRY